MMVNTLLASMKMLWDVLILTMFFICIFALVGMQVFVGVLRNKCAEPVPENLRISYRDYASNSSEYLMYPLKSFCFVILFSLPRYNTCCAKELFHRASVLPLFVCSRNRMHFASICILDSQSIVILINWLSL